MSFKTHIKSININIKNLQVKGNESTDMFKAMVVEHFQESDLDSAEGYNPEVDEEFANAMEAIQGSYTEKELAELTGEPTLEDGPLRAIIGTDDRVEITSTSFPYRAICNLQMKSQSGKYYLGSGFFISPRVVVTAGHCLYFHEDGGWADSIEVTTRMLGNQKPYGSAVSRRFCSLIGWTKNKDINYDIGVIILPKDSKLGNNTGWFGYSWRDPQYYKGRSITNAGYPGDKPFGEMWGMSGKIDSLMNSNYKIKYFIDTIGGQSGSPVWEVRNGSYYVLGVHTNGMYNKKGQGIYNLATRLDKNKFEFIKSYREKDFNNTL